jgi:hypothetical protein
VVELKCIATGEPSEVEYVSSEERNVKSFSAPSNFWPLLFGSAVPKLVFNTKRHETNRIQPNRIRFAMYYSGGARERVFGQSGKAVAGLEESDQ